MNKLSDYIVNVYSHLVYIDGSLGLRDASINWLANYKLNEASIGTGFNWNAGMLDVSGGGDVTKAYVDGSISVFATNVSTNIQINQLNASIGRIDISLNNVVDISILLAPYTTNTSIGTSLSYFVRSASTGVGLFWNAGMLDVSVAGGGGDVTKLYVDGSLATKVSKAGDTMTGNLTAPLYNIVNGAHNLDVDGDSYTRLYGMSGVKLSVYNSDYVDALTVAPTTGNVGIGTAAPEEILTVKKVTSTTEKVGVLLQTGANDIGDGLAISFGFNTDSGTTPNGAAIAVVTATSGKELVFRTTTGNAACAERVRIDGNGNVGIGTPTPSVPLEVAGIITARNYVQVLDTGGAEGFKMQWNDTEKSIDFIIN